VERNLYCTVVEVPVLVPGSQVKRSARDLLPWADPYIAGLIRRLQDEVRQERADRRNSRIALLSGTPTVRGESSGRTGELSARRGEWTTTRGPCAATGEQLARPPGELASPLDESSHPCSEPRSEMAPPGNDGRLDFDTADYETWPQCDDVPGNRRW